MKKGRHRRYEEARAFKRESGQFTDFEGSDDPCDECGALPGEESKPWCMSCESTAGEEGALFPS